MWSIKMLITTEATNHIDRFKPCGSKRYEPEFSLFDSHFRIISGFSRKKINSSFFGLVLIVFGLNLYGIENMYEPKSIQNETKNIFLYFQTMAIRDQK